MSRRDYLYSEIAHVMNELISKVEQDKGVVAPFERFKTSVDWRLDRGADKYNQMVQLFKDQGYTFNEEIPLVGDSDDWTQALIGHYLEKEIFPVVMGESGVVSDLTSYVASLNGTNQAWVLSKQLIDVNNLEGLSLKGNFEESSGIYFANGTGGDFRVYSSGGKVTAQIGGDYTTDFANAYTGDIEFRFEDGKLVYLVDGVELYNGSYSKGSGKGSSATVIGGRINSDGSVGFSRKGAAKNISISQSGVDLFISPLSDKDAGEVQVSTVGSVTATMVNYTPDTWIPYIEVEQYLSANGSTQGWNFGEKLIDVDNLNGLTIECTFFTDGDGTLIAQSTGEAATREFQYYRYESDICLRIGGGDALVLDRLTAVGEHKLEFGDGVVRITINGIEVYDGVHPDNGSRESDAVTTVLKRGGGHNKSGGAADFKISRDGSVTYENSLTKRVELDQQVPTVGSAIATFENFTPSLWTNRYITDADILTEKYIVFFGASIMERSFDQSTRTETAYEGKGLSITSFCRAFSGDTSYSTRIKAISAAREFSKVTKQGYAFQHTGGNDASLYGPYPNYANQLGINIEDAAQTLKAANFKLIMTPISYREPPASNPTLPYNTNVVDALVTQYADHAVDMHTFTLNAGDDYFGTGGGDGIHPSDPDGEILTVNYVVDSTYQYIQSI